MSFPSTTTCSHTWFGTGRGCKSPGVLSCRVLLRPHFLQFLTYLLISLLRPYHQYSHLISSTVLFCPVCTNKGGSCASRIRAVLRKILTSAVVSGTARHPSWYPCSGAAFSAHIKSTRSAPRGTSSSGSSDRAEIERTEMVATEAISWILSEGIARNVRSILSTGIKGNVRSSASHSRTVGVSMVL